LQNANDAATALEVSVTSDAGGTNVGQKNITVKNNVIFINVTGFKYSQPKLTVMMNKNYKPGAANAAPAKKVAPKTVKVITCVKGKITKKVSTAACPSGYKKK
jgi:flagellar basal body rod protein FlgG